MAHIRKRKFNTKKTYPEQKIDNDLCMSVRAGNLVFLRGQVGQTLEGKVVHVGDAGKQADQAMRNVKTLLEEQGSCLDDICKITVYLVDRGYREAVYQAIGKWLKGVFPVSTGLVIDGLARPEYLMEIDVFAVIPDERMAKLGGRDGAKTKPRGKSRTATGRPGRSARRQAT
jgi:enamine deaminase RidA (YjgF/YER057c/UK114 family)